MSTFAFNGAGEIPVVPIVPDEGGLLRDQRALAAFIVAVWQGSGQIGFSLTCRRCEALDAPRIVCMSGLELVYR